MLKIAFIYPGQGAQADGMGQDFYEESMASKSLMDQANEVLDFDLLSMCYEKDERLNQTEFTQPALVATELAMTKEVLALGLKPDITAGLSLGEYTAIAVAGSLDEMDAIRTVRKRGIYMEQAVPEGHGMMAAVLGMDEKQVEAVLEKINGASIANYNCPGQIVITGYKKAVEEAIVQLQKAGAKRVLPLQVSGPFHSEYMKEAGEKLSNELENVTLHTLKIPYITNVNAEVISVKESIKQLLVQQVSSSVLWQQSVEKMLDLGITTFVEIGPGKTLSNLVKKTVMQREKKEMKKLDIQIYQIRTIEEAKSVVGEILCQTNK